MKRTILFLLVAMMAMVSCDIRKSNPKPKQQNADAWRMTRIDSSSMMLSWNYNMDTPTLVTVYVGKTNVDEGGLVFRGSIGANADGFITQAINISSDSVKSFFVSIYAENPEKLLFEKELANVDTFEGYTNEPWSYYVAKK